VAVEITVNLLTDWDISSESSGLGGRIPTPSSVARLLNERKSLAAIYITCRALIVVLQTVQKNVLDEFMGNRLEESTFEQFRRPNLWVTPFTDDNLITDNRK
jgi:hypothetical protein